MKVALVQLQSELLEIRKNAEKHVAAVVQAAEQEAKMVVFPELSLTGYSLKTKDICTSREYKEVINQLEIFSQRLNIILCVGAPREGNNGLHISMLIFRPDKPLISYDKSILHNDETPFYVEGTNDVEFSVDPLHIGIGICYEALQVTHFLKCAESNCDIYIASVAKTTADTQNSCERLSSWSRDGKIPILFVNSVGPCEGFEAGGGSTVWNSKGVVKGFLNNTEEGILIYDIEDDVCASYILKQGV